MQAASIAWAAPWMAESLITAPSVMTATRSCLVPLLGVLRKLLYALARRKCVHIPARTPRAPRPASTYTMLVESDVQRGMRGILP